MKLVKQALSEQSSVFLNLVRVVACELIVLGHFLTKYQPVPYDELFRLGSTMGGAAVLLFFVLSGMLISYSLFTKLDNPKYGFRSYFVDRFSRIYSGLIPALLLAAGLSAVIYLTNYGYFMELCAMQSAPSPLTFGMTALMLERFPISFFNSLLSGFGLTFPLPEVTPFGFNGILWTLVVEWWIYMIFGWLVIGALAFTGRRHRSTVYKAAVVVGAGLLGLVLAALFSQYSSFVVIWFFGVLLMLGVGSETVRTKLAGWRQAKNAAAALLVVSLVVTAFAVYAAYSRTIDYYSVWLDIVLSICVFLGVVLLNLGMPGQTKQFFTKRSAGFIGAGAAFSYTLFLIHYPIIIILNGLDLPGNRLLMLIPILLITNLTAVGIACFTEKRHRKLASAIKRLLHIEQPESIHSKSTSTN